MTPQTSSCGQCGTVILIESSVIHCVICRQAYHNWCIKDVTTDEAKKIQSKSNVLGIICIKCRAGAAKKKPYLDDVQVKELINSEIEKRLTEASESVIRENDELKKMISELQQVKSDYEKRFVYIEAVNKQQHEQIKALNKKVDKSKEIEQTSNSAGRSRAKRARSSDNIDDRSQSLNVQIRDIITPMLKNFSDDLFERVKQELKPVLVQQSKKVQIDFISQGQPRQRSLSRNSTRSAIDNQITQSYASVLTNTKTDVASIRNIICEGDNASITQQRLANDNLCADVRILSIKKKGKNFITVRCTNEEEANKLEDTINRKYRDEIKITKVR